VPGAESEPHFANVGFIVRLFLKHTGGATEEMQIAQALAFVELLKDRRLARRN
jgi:hypothetical protein